MKQALLKLTRLALNMEPNDGTERWAKQRHAFVSGLFASKHCKCGRRISDNAPACFECAEVA